MRVGNRCRFRVDELGVGLFGEKWIPHILTSGKFVIAVAEQRRTIVAITDIRGIDVRCSKIGESGRRRG